MTSNFKFKIVVPAYNCQEWIGRCLDSIAQQTYQQFDVCIIDDASTHSNQRAIIEDYCQRHGWQCHFNETNQGALTNIVNGINWLAPTDEDVIVTVDGDDWLYNEDVLQRLHDIYAQGDVYLTYGQFVTYPRWNIGSCRPIDPEVIERGELRKIPWCFSHLRTFKFLLWRQIKDEDLRDENGEYYRVTWDLAFMYPMLEMAGYRFRFIDDITYVYNKANPINDHKLHRERQFRTETAIRSKPPYPPLFQGKAALSTATALTPLKYLGLKLWWKLKRELGLGK